MRGVATPAIAVARAAAIDHVVHEYAAGHARSSDGWGLEAARELAIDPARVFKTLVVALDDGRLAIAIIPASGRLRLKAAAAVFGAREARMAATRDAERATGYVAGGISPLGQRRGLPTAIDASVFGFATVHVSAGRRGLEIELSPSDLARLTGAAVADLTS